MASNFLVQTCPNAVCLRVKNSWIKGKMDIIHSRFRYADESSRTLASYYCPRNSVKTRRNHALSRARFKSYRRRHKTIRDQTCRRFALACWTACSGARLYQSTQSLRSIVLEVCSVERLPHLYTPIYRGVHMSMFFHDRAVYHRWAVRHIWFESVVLS
jgi:hypothetical protein